MLEEQIKQQHANQIAEIFSSIKNCKVCPIENTCNWCEYQYGNTLCRNFKEKDNLNIID